MKWWALIFAVLAVGCSHYEDRLPAQSAPQPVAIAPAKNYEATEPPREREPQLDADEVRATGPLAAAPAARRVAADESAPSLKTEVYAVQQTFGGGSAGSGSAPPTPPPTPNPIEVSKPTESAKAPAEMIDVEAHVELEVDNIERATGAIRSLVSEAGGSVVNEVVEDKPSSAGAALSLRVPTPKIHYVLDSLAKTGKLLSRKIESKDIGREYHDAAILVQNLEATMKRYEELLSKAQAPPQVLEIEKELARVRTQLDRVKGDMRWMRDRATMATIYVTLSAPHPESSTVEPTATLYPGVRATSIVDFSDGSRAYLGGGLSVRVGRPFSVDADWLTRAKNGSGVDFFIASAGSELYSDLLGGGRRRFLNPYLGFRVGYANISDDGALALGGVLGVELLKTKVVILELDGRGYGLVGIENKTHGALQTTLGLNIAY